MTVAKGLCSICGLLLDDLKAVRDLNGDRLWICRVRCDHEERNRFVTGVDQSGDRG